MTISKKLISTVLAFTMSSAVFGYEVVNFKKELVRIQSFSQLLQEEQNTQSQKIVKFCEKILSDRLTLSDEEMLMLDRIVTSEKSLESKKSDILAIVLKEAKKKANKQLKKEVKKTKKAYEAVMKWEFIDSMLAYAMFSAFSYVIGFKMGSAPSV